MPAVSVCRGRVMSRRAPVAGAAVMVRRGSVREERYPLPVDPDSSTHLVLVRTDAEGRFEVGSVDGDGPVELRARAGTGVVWSDPVEGRLALGDGATEVVLGIPGGAVRGRFDVAPWPGAERRDAHVELYPMEHADRAPRHSIWSSDGPRWLRHLARSVPLGPDGGFAFEGLPAGTWVLRLWRSPDRWPRVVSLGEDENLDVGTIVAPTAVPLGIETGLGPEHGVEIFRLVDTAEVYIRGIVPRDGALDWGALPPGRYRLRACPVKVVSFSGPYGGSTALRLDEPEGDPVDITVGADGRCTPARVW